MCTNPSQETAERRKRLPAGSVNDDFQWNSSRTGYHCMKKAGEGKINLDKGKFDYLYRSAPKFYQRIGSGLPSTKNRSLKLLFSSIPITFSEFWEKHILRPEHDNLIASSRLPSVCTEFLCLEPRLFWIPGLTTEKPGTAGGIY